MITVQKFVKTQSDLAKIKAGETYAYKDHAYYPIVIVLHKALKDGSEWIKFLETSPDFSMIIENQKNYYKKIAVFREII